MKKPTKKQALIVAISILAGAGIYLSIQIFGATTANEAPENAIDTTNSTNTPHDTTQVKELCPEQTK